MTKGGHPVAEPGSPAPPIPAPLRHSCPPPSFLRRQESSRSTQARTQRPIPTALNRPRDPPAKNALHKPAPLRHSCPPPSFLRRQESSRATQARTQQPTPTALNRPLDPPAKSALHKPFPLRHSCPPPSLPPRSVIPAPLRHSCPPPSFLRRQESRRSTQARTQRPTPTALNRPLDPPAQNALHKPAPLRRSRPPPSFLPPSVIPAKAGIQPSHPSTHAATNPHGAEPPTRPTR